jgi:HK97 gp10 family phage protein
MARTPAEINKKLRALVNEQKKAVDQALLQGANTMSSSVKSVTPSDTGTTAAAYKVVTKTAKPSPVLDIPNNYYVLTFDDRDDVAFYLEYGTVKMEPKPFLRPVYGSNIEKLKKIGVQAAINVLKKFNS